MISAPNRRMIIVGSAYYSLNVDAILWYKLSTAFLIAQFEIHDDAKEIEINELSKGRYFAFFVFFIFGSPLTMTATLQGVLYFRLIIQGLINLIFAVRLNH